MSGIVEIWRRSDAAAMPVRFTVGDRPQLADGETIEGPVVSKITFRESGSFAGVRLNKGAFVIEFEDSFVQRFIPEKEVIDMAYETKQANVAKTPALPEE